MILNRRPRYHVKLLINVVDSFNILSHADAQSISCLLTRPLVEWLIAVHPPCYHKSLRIHDVEILRPFRHKSLKTSQLYLINYLEYGILNFSSTRLHISRTVVLKLSNLGSELAQVISSKTCSC